MKVSIIVPVYNVEEYIVSCLMSVSKQSVKNDIECIIIDDCGTDNSIQIAKEWIKKYKSQECDGIIFKFLHHNFNKGLSAARNTGIDAAIGQYVYFLDSDDEITPNCIEELLATAEKYGDIDLVQGSFTEIPSYINKHTKRPFECYTNDRRKAKTFLMSYDLNPVTAQNRLVRRQLIIDNKIYFKEGIIHEDNHWTYFLAKYVRTMAICKTPTYFHRYNPNSITHSRSIEKETKAYGTLIRDFSNDIDQILPGHQKELILNTLIMTLRSGYYKSEDDKKDLIQTFMSNNTLIEKCMFYFYLMTKSSKILHALSRYYKLNDK